MEVVKAASSLMVPKKFRSVREKNGGHRRNRSSESGAKARPLTADSWLSIFKPDSAKQAQKEKEEEEKEAAKVEAIAKRLTELNYHEISKDIIRVALRSNFAAGDTDKAVELLQLQQQAFSGIIQPYDPNVEMLGAENRGNVTCYLDSLLFAMFAHLTAFESMLQNDLESEPQRKLAALLRLWVNMLRSGKLIHTDMMEHIQQALADCGWKEAALLEQQDTSEAFAFIADALQLPLLALQVDLFHQGKGDADDHKVVHERCLNLAVPPDPDGKGIKLEDCLEEYFNNKVDVLRDSVEEKTPVDRPTLSPSSTIRLVSEEPPVTSVGIQSRPPDLRRPFKLPDQVDQYHPTGVPIRQNTLIDIPDSLRLPHFMVVDDPKAEEQNPNGLSQGYKLVLQSAICHRGDSLHSGHYVAYARVAPKLLTDNRRHDHDPPPDYEEAQWVKFDDLAIEKRVETVDDIQQCLRRQEEMPYVLIYQIVPMVDVTTASTDGSVTEPPSYLESATNVPGTPSVGAPSDHGGTLSKSTSAYFDSATTLAHSGPHLRPSSETDRPPRFSFDDDPSALTMKANVSRRASITFSEPVIANPVTNPESVSPAVTTQEETAAARLSRAAAKFKTGASKSRPTSQVGEGRISLTMSRFGFGRQSRDSSNGANGVSSSETSANEQGPTVDGEESNGKDKEEELLGPHQHHHHQKKDKGRDKDRTKSKSRDRDEKKDKDKGKGKAAKESAKNGVPDRECVVM
ncbi:419a408e-6118-47d8-84e2-0f37ae6858fa [Thermothielavioides terrestris]|uniref:ubiquitinyl hydrolase 1 n=1 Tax=Thermothielavioides terrestris TaxID=2587410 RepID=A0A3S4AMW1_9PEZI|nr:419a408e-6118-47d8-84e2-0f37ae6858fa [Thermothielavioides terrestris]